MRSSYEIPEELKAAAQQNLVLFIGAGVSRLGGGASWDQFADNYIYYLQKHNILDFATIEQLTSLSTKEKLSIARHIEKKRRPSPQEFRSLLITKEPSPEALSFFRNIIELEVPIVTTNYDDLLERVAIDYYTEKYPSGERTPKVTADVNNINPAKLALSNSIIHLHGSIQFPEQAIVSDIDYIKHYAKGHIKIFLQNLFKNYTVVFMGYGLAEAEILAHFFNLEDGSKLTSFRRYWLKDYFRFESHLEKLQKKYFEDEFNITILPYYKDLKNFDELFYFFEEIKLLSPADQSRLNPVISIFEDAFDDQS